MANPEGLKSAFKTPDDLIKYVDTHRHTERALVHDGHLALAGFIAGWDISDIPGNVFERDSFRSLHTLDAEKLCEDAQRRIEAGEIPDDWVEQCVSQLANRACMDHMAAGDP